MRTAALVLAVLSVLTELLAVTSAMTMTIPYGIAGTCGTPTTSGSGATSGTCPGGVLTPDTAQVQINQFASAGTSGGSAGNVSYATWGNGQTTPWYNWVGTFSYSMDLNYSLNLAAGDVKAHVNCGSGSGSGTSARAILGYLYNIWDITGSSWVWSSDITGVLYDTGHITCATGTATVSNSAISNSGQTPNYIIAASTPLLTSGHWYRIKIQVSCITYVNAQNTANTNADSDCYIQGSDFATLENAGVWT